MQIKSAISKIISDYPQFVQSTPTIDCPNCHLDQAKRVERSLDYSRDDIMLIYYCCVIPGLSRKTPDLGTKCILSRVCPQKTGNRGHFSIIGRNTLPESLHLCSCSSLIQVPIVDCSGDHPTIHDTGIQRGKPRQ